MSSNVRVQIMTENKSGYCRDSSVGQIFLGSFFFFKDILSHKEKINKDISKLYLESSHNTHNKNIIELCIKS